MDILDHFSDFQWLLYEIFTMNIKFDAEIIFELFILLFLQETCETF